MQTGHCGAPCASTLQHRHNSFPVSEALGQFVGFLAMWEPPSVSEKHLEPRCCSYSKLQNCSRQLNVASKVLVG